MFSEPKQKKKGLYDSMLHYHWIPFCLGSWSPTWSNWLINADLAAWKEGFWLGMRHNSQIKEFTLFQYILYYSGLGLLGFFYLFKAQ